MNHSNFKVSVVSAVAALGPTLRQNNSTKIHEWYYLLAFFVFPWCTRTLRQTSRYGTSTLTLPHYLPLFLGAIVISISQEAVRPQSLVSACLCKQQPGECRESTSSPGMSTSLTETSLATDAAEGHFPDAQQPRLTANCHRECCALKELCEVQVYSNSAFIWLYDLQHHWASINPPPPQS